MGWSDAEGALNAAENDADIGKALEEMQRELAGSASLREEMPKGKLIKKCMGKRKAAGAAWGPSSKKAFQALITVYAKPVVPPPAYKGQTMPPAYLFTAPTTNVENEDDDEDPEGDKFKYTNNFVYKPPAASSTDIEPPAFIPAAPGARDDEVDDPDDDVPPPPKIDVPPPPAPLPPNIQSVEAAAEYMIDCSADGVGGDEVTTDVWCASDEYDQVTHINLFNNDVNAVEGLGKFPCLLRMTLRSNDCQTLAGLSEAKYLRWLDASSNDLKDIAGVDNMYALEWLDLRDNDLPSLDGCKFCPNVTFLNLQHNDLKDVEGVKQFPNLRWIDLSSNDLKTVEGLAACRNLVEINLNFNSISSLKALMQLAKLPYLRRLDLSNNKLSTADRGRIHNYFQKFNRDCRVIFDSELGDLARAQQAAGADDSGCCSIM